MLSYSFFLTIHSQKFLVLIFLNYRFYVGLLIVFIQFPDNFISGSQLRIYPFHRPCRNLRSVLQIIYRYDQFAIREDFLNLCSGEILPHPSLYHGSNWTFFTEHCYFSL